MSATRWPAGPYSPTDVSGWSQTITVGFERITGTRLPYQRPDGTFTASKSRVVAVDADWLRSLLTNDGDLADLFPGQRPELVSKPGSKAVRVRIGPGVAMIGLGARPDGRTKVTVGHEELPGFEDVGPWKTYWAQWLDVVSSSGDG